MKFYNYIRKSPKKTIQIIIFVLLIFIFVINHYSFIRPCVKWEKENHKKLDINAFEALATGNANYIKGQYIYEEINVCKKYGFIPNSMSIKYPMIRSVPADLIFLFIGTGILYFTKDIKSKFNK